MIKLLSVYNEEDNKILTSPSRLVNGNDWNDWTIKLIISTMKEFSTKYPNSIWFSAIQLWYPIQLFYINLRSTEAFNIKTEFESFIINPVIKRKSEETFDWYEWCMSIADQDWIPTNRRKVKRSVEIIFDYIDEFGILHDDCKLSWFAAVVFQHEYDHIMGKLINETWYDIISPEKYQIKKEYWEKLFLDY